MAYEPDSFINKFFLKYLKADPINDMRQLDLKVKNIIDSPNAGSNVSQSATTTTANDATATTKTDNLYDEYRKRLEQIKKIKPIK